MLNNIILIGRLTEDPVIRSTTGGQSVTTITLAVARNYKNVDGEYDTDFIPCTVWEGLANSVTEYCKKGSTVAIRGRISVRDANFVISKDPEVKKSIRIPEIIAEKVSFIRL